MSLRMTIASQVTSLGVYVLNKRAAPEVFEPLPDEFKVVKFAWTFGDSYTNAYDQWVAAEAAATALGGDKVYLAAYSDGVWYVIESLEIIN